MSILGKWGKFMRRFSNSTLFRCPVAILGIAAVSLFFVGPQLGSLDTDGDGYPDTPVVAFGSIPVARPSNFVSNKPSSRIRTAGELADFVKGSYLGERDDPGSPAGRTALKSFCLLRC